MNYEPIVRAWKNSDAERSLVPKHSASAVDRQNEIETNIEELEPRRAPLILREDEILG